MKEEIDQETKELEENRETNETDLEESVAEDNILAETDKVDDPVEQVEQTEEKEIIDEDMLMDDEKMLNHYGKLPNKMLLWTRMFGINKEHLYKRSIFRYDEQA